MALRIARREARRARGRAALVVALIALPVFAMTFVAVSYDSVRLSAEQEIDRDLGAADAMVTWPYDGPVRHTPDLLVQGAAPDTPPRESAPTAAELRAVLPPGSHAVPWQRGTLEMRTEAGHAELAAEWLDLADPVHHGRVMLRDGRAPTGDSEVALTRQGADRLGAAIGDRVGTADGERHWTVVGIAEYPFRFRAAVLLPPSDGPVRAESWLVSTPEPVTWEVVRDLNAHGLVVRSRQVLLDPPPPEQVELYVIVIEGGSGGATEVAVGVLLVGLALLEVVLLAGPAFAVGARRRQRELALVAAAGGTPAHLRRIVLADGVVLGAAGAVVGIALGLVCALGALPLLEEYLLQRRAGGVRVFPLALAGVAGLAVVTGLAAALVPAAVAARQPVVAALAGRRGVTRSRRRWLVLGVVAVAIGAAAAVAGAWQLLTPLVLAGLILAQLGLVLCTPALVGLVSRLGRLLPLAPRIALRDTARNRAAAAPAISAVMAAVAGALTLGIYLTAAEQRSHTSYRAGLPVGHVAVGHQLWRGETSDVLSAEERDQVRHSMRSALSAERVFEVSAPACPADSGAEYCQVRVPVAERHRCPAEDLIDERARETGSGRVDALLSAAEQREARADPRCQEPWRGWMVHLGSALIDDGTALAALTGAGGSDLAPATATLAAGGVVVADPRKVIDGRATLEIIRHDGEREQVTEVDLPAYTVTSGENVPFAVLSPGALEQTGLVAEPYATVAATSAVPTEEQEDALRAALRAIAPELTTQIERGRFGSEDPFLLILAAVAAVVALAAAGIATGLAAADRRGDLATLAAVGSTPGVRRKVSTSQAGVIAGLGAALGTAAGAGSAAAILVALNQAEAYAYPVPAAPYQLAVPWQALGLLLVVVPAIAMLGAGLLTRSRLPIERRRE